MGLIPVDKIWVEKKGWEKSEWKKDGLMAFDKNKHLKVYYYQK